MQLESTSQSPFRASFMAVAVVATCAVSSASGFDTSSRILANEASRAPSTHSNSTNRVRESEREFFVVGQNHPTSDVSYRETTEREHAIAELLRWRHLGTDWDGEGAKAPSLLSLTGARAFLCAMTSEAVCPEPMLFPSGRAGLYWREEGFYADLEFYENRTIAYYIERGHDRHKGVVDFDLDNIPAVFQTLLLGVTKSAVHV